MVYRYIFISRQVVVACGRHKFLHPDVEHVAFCDFIFDVFRRPILKSHWTYPAVEMFNVAFITLYVPLRTSFGISSQHVEQHNVSSWHLWKFLAETCSRGVGFECYVSLHFIWVECYV